MAKKNPSMVAALTYEQAMLELEDIVTQLEGDARDLEDVLRLFERGKALAAHCQQLLEKAELKVRLLEPSAAEDTEQ